MEQREVTFDTSDSIPLVGTLTTPGAGTWPAALILNGSGPLDRNSAMKGQALGFADALATELATVGVASLRFDKRGVGTSGGDYLSMGLDTETNDAARALACLTTAPEVDSQRVALIGHSVGALISFRLAAFEPAVNAVVALAGPAQDGRSVLAWQAARIADSLRGPSWLLPKIVLTGQRFALRKMERSQSDTARLPIKRQPARWMREFMAYDPVTDLRQVRCPVLAITGQKDLQVDPHDVARVGSLVAGKFTGETPSDLTHVLRREGGPAGILTYGSQLKQPIDAELLMRVSTWVANTLDPMVSK